MNHLRPCLIIGLLSLFATPLLAQREQAATTWSDSSGQFRLEAQFVRMEGDNVILKRSDGREVPVPMSRLSSESQSKAKAAAATKPAKPSIPVPAPAVASSTDAIVIPPNLSAQQFADLVFNQVKQGNLIVIWDALPPSYQNDVQQIVQSAASKMDPSLTDPIMKIRDDVLKILKTKKPFILGNAMVQKALPDTASVNKLYDPMVDLLDAYLAKEMLQVSQLNNQNLRAALQKYLSNISQKAAALESSVPATSPMADMAKGANWKNTKYSVESISSNEANVTISTPDQKSQSFTVVRVEDRWVPKEIAEDWTKKMSEAKSAVAELTPEKINQAKQQMQMVTMMANGLLGGLLAANDQASFDQAIGAITPMLPIGAGGTIAFPGTK